MVGGEKAQEIVFGLHAQVVHVEARRGLVGDVPEDVEARHQVVVDAFQNGIIDHPGGLRASSSEALQDSGVVVVPEDGEQRVRIAPIPIPDPFQGRAAPVGVGGCDETLPQIQIAGLFATVGEPQLPREDSAPVLRGKFEEGLGVGKKIGLSDRRVMIRIQEGDEKVILDHVHGDLPMANRTADESHHEVLGVVEEELVAAPRGDLVEGHEGVCSLLGFVTR